MKLWIHLKIYFALNFCQKLADQNSIALINFIGLLLVQKLKRNAKPRIAYYLNRVMIFSTTSVKTQVHGGANLKLNERHTLINNLILPFIEPIT